MGRQNGPYKAEFPPGSRVRIASRDVLERFAAEWKLHNPIQSEQLEFSGTIAIVADVGYYHGGDELYKLQDIPGIWHKVCLEALSAS